MEGSYLEGSYLEGRMHRNRSDIEKARRRSCQGAALEISAGIVPLSAALTNADH